MASTVSWRQYAAVSSLKELCTVHMIRSRSYRCFSLPYHSTLGSGTAEDAENMSSAAAAALANGAAKASARRTARIAEVLEVAEVRCTLRHA